MWAWAWVYLGLWALTVGVAVAVWTMPGGRGIARWVLGLTLSAERNPTPGVWVVATIAVGNALHGGWPLALGAVGVGKRRVSRVLADVAVAGNLLVCAALVGGAVGGYGLRVLEFLPHVPLEWAGVAAGGAGWVVERRGLLGARQRGWWVCMLMGLLVLAAVVESCFVPHR